MLVLRGGLPRFHACAEQRNKRGRPEDGRNDRLAELALSRHRQFDCEAIHLCDASMMVRVIHQHDGNTH
jgi:hypothetical protein